MLSLSCLLILSFHCDDDDFKATIAAENAYSGIADDTNDTPSPALPVPGNAGIIIASLLPSGDVHLSWSRASDGTTEQAKLLYRAFYSLKSNINTVDGAESFGTPVSNWVADAISASVIGLDEGKQYYFNVVVATPDGRKAAYTMTAILTPGTVYLYAANGSHTGKLTTPFTVSARADVDAYCVPKTSLSVIAVPSFSHYHAFISISADDAIINFPSRYALPANWKIKSFSGNIIAHNWADLFDGSINMKLEAAGVVDTFWWSASNTDGSYDTENNCGGWTVGTNAKSGRTGAHNALDSDWIFESTRNCNNSLKLLCIGW